MNRYMYPRNSILCLETLDTRGSYASWHSPAFPDESKYECVGDLAVYTEAARGFCHDTGRRPSAVVILLLRGEVDIWCA
jgi:hypothetical protein